MDSKMQPENKQKIFNVRTIVGLSILGLLCLLGLVLDPRANTGNVITMGLVAALYIESRRRMVNGGMSHGDKTSISLNMRRLSVATLVLGILGFIFSFAVLGGVFAAISIVTACIYLSQRGYSYNNQHPNIAASINSYDAMGIIGILLSVVAIVTIAMMISLSSWPVDPIMIVRFISPN